MKLKTLTATLVATTLSTAALAQGLTGTVTGTVSGAADTVGGAVTGTAQGEANATANAPINHGQVVSGLRKGISDTAKWVQTAAMVGAETEVQIVTLSQLKGNGAENAAAIDTALAAEAGLGDARASISANTHLQSKLSAAGYGADDVVAFYASGENSVVVVVDDRT